MSSLKKLEFISVILSNSDLSGCYRSMLRGCLPSQLLGRDDPSMNFPWGSLLRQGDIQGIYYFYDLFKRIQESLE